MDCIRYFICEANYPLFFNNIKFEQIDRRIVTTIVFDGKSNEKYFFNLKNSSKVSFLPFRISSLKIGVKKCDHMI